MDLNLNKASNGNNILAANPVFLTILYKMLYSRPKKLSLCIYLSLVRMRTKIYIIIYYPFLWDSYNLSILWRKSLSECSFLLLKVTLFRIDWSRNLIFWCLFRSSDKIVNFPCRCTLQCTGISKACSIHMVGNFCCCLLINIRLLLLAVNKRHHFSPLQTFELFQTLDLVLLNNFIIVVTQQTAVASLRLLQIL